MQINDFGACPGVLSVHLLPKVFGQVGLGVVKIFGIPIVAQVVFFSLPIFSKEKAFPKAKKIDYIFQLQLYLGNLSITP